MTSGHTKHDARRQRDEDLILPRQLFRTHAMDGRVEVRVVPMACSVSNDSDGKAATPLSQSTNSPSPEGQANEGSGRGRERVIRGGWTALRYWLLCADCACSAL